MIIENKSLVERLGWHHEHPVTGKMVLVNPDGPEAAAYIERLEREKARLHDDQQPMADGYEDMTAAEDVLAWLIIEKIGSYDGQSYTPREASSIIEARLDEVAALESELSRLKSPMEGAKTTAEERATYRLRIAKWRQYRNLNREEDLTERLLDDLDHATAQARSAAAELVKIDGEVFIGHRRYDPGLYRLVRAEPVDDKEPLF